MSIERRAFAAELRAKGRRLEGYAATFGTEAKILDYTETIAPGAFRAALAANKDILGLVDHDPGKVLARTKSGTLLLHEDSRGLRFDIYLPDTSVGRDVLALAERGDLGGMSFAFVPLVEQWEDDRRELRSVDLKEISVVSAWPAYDNTTVLARTKPTTPLRPRVAVYKRFLDTV
jgi:Escherichia/Staphylococcus phage prohead protease